jgi:hypothetical protein
LQRADIFDPGTSASTFASSLIVHPAEEALEKLSRNLMITLYRISSIKMQYLKRREVKRSV